MFRRELTIGSSTLSIETGKLAKQADGAVIIRQGDGHGVGSMSREGAGTCLGEVSFFDGLARSASVWSIDDCHVAAMSTQQFDAFEQQHPRLARDLLFALGCVLAARLRRANTSAAINAVPLMALDPFLR